MIIGTVLITLTALAIIIAGVAIILNLPMSESTISLLSKVVGGLVVGTLAITSTKPRGWDLFWEMVNIWRG